MSLSEEVDALVEACHWIGSKGWCPATGGNMSIRSSEHSTLITRSGVDKATLTATDLLHVNLESNQSKDGRKPSAETGLHTLLYRLYPDVGTVLHTHSVSSTVLSMTEPSQAIILQHYEMQKALSGIHTHEGSVQIPIFDNNQDIDALALEVQAHAATTPLAYGFLVRGHGLYSWGPNTAIARRHLEALEFLFACELQRRQLL